MIFKRLSETFRELGVFAGLVYLAQVALRPLNPFVALFLYELVEQPVAASPNLSARHLAAVRWVEVRPGGAELDRMPPLATVKQMRFGQGARCIAVHRGDDFIGYVWFGFQRYIEDEVRCIYLLDRPASSSFDFDFYIFQEFRLGRAFATVWDAANEFLRANGVTHTYSRISRFNLASRRSHLRLGARLLGQAFFVHLGPLEISWSRLFRGLPMRLTLKKPAQLHL